ncbi:hypothetical protein COU13_01775 [Candidatus Kaiserbacteria bacterium CG10_big_fil_rev_8_21_14_0_10_43_70]|uniref:GST N-terminal domain-containing protein n=1 Tax=Candidatus Kaiserbacteria bacterium CG10_big_fil_rev_8_21_14_0_10_43_70 TaxID=1974605 RepID=A0A2H0UIS1_9BACT|nr:MAG: hypothetical protein COU13_01775 [Candidatus Kaiserbacteria bacterium CG10_big_fil_rev_8_21_14_0_10_43_70]
MMTLYVKTGCQFCARTLKAADELGIELHLKNVADEGVYDELATVGGKRQEPFLVDEENDVKMYESDAIIDYFESLTGKKATRHQSTPGVCAI